VKVNDRNDFDLHIPCALRAGDPSGDSLAVRAGSLNFSDLKTSGINFDAGVLVALLCLLFMGLFL
jgi:hypothetical protein